jgi:hypothetical protein
MNPSESPFPETLLQAVRAALTQAEWRAERWDGGRVECTDDAGHPWQLSLDNLYRRLQRCEPADWVEEAVEFLRRMAAPRTGTGADADLGDLTDRLLVRVGLPFSGVPEKARVWSQPIPRTPLVVSLIIDHPDSMTHVSAAMVERSGRPGEEWLPQALDNLRERTPAGAAAPIDEQSGLLMCNVNDGYDSARALLLDVLVPGSAALGSFVALPNRESLLILPLTPPALLHLHMLKSVTRTHFKKAPYPISDEVFWVRGGEWYPVAIERRGGNLSLGVPDELGDLLERMRGGE